MRKMIWVLLAVVLAVPMVQAENEFIDISATTTATTDSFSQFRRQVMICNYGSDIIHFRLFDGDDTSGAATTAHSDIPAGSATEPKCKSFPFDEDSQQGLGFVGYSVRAATGTATVTIDAV